MKSKRTFFVLLAVLAASLLLVTAVSADTVAGTGWIRAQGNGRAALHGNVANLYLSGDGVLWFKDRGDVDEPIVTGDGRRIEHPNGWVQYIGFNGTFHLRAADRVSVILRGRDINLFAAGRGVVHLVGSGTYTVGSGETILHGTWPEAGQTLDFGGGAIEE